jgi:hypothetical protein
MPEVPFYVESRLPEAEMIQNQGPTANLHDFNGCAVQWGQGSIRDKVTRDLSAICELFPKYLKLMPTLRTPLLINLNRRDSEQFPCPCDDGGRSQNTLTFVFL